MKTNTTQTNSQQASRQNQVDSITLDIIENALLNARFEMDSVVARISLSPVIREQHDAFPMICDAKGRMIVGQFGSYIPGVLESFGDNIHDGDVFENNIGRRRVVPIVNREHAMQVAAANC